MRQKGYASPYLPWRLPTGPKGFQKLLVSERVHRLPKSPMAKRPELLFGGQAFKGFALKNGAIVREIVEHRRLEDKETPVNPPFSSLGLFRELLYRLAI